jgi:hypothetical protein
MAVIRKSVIEDAIIELEEVQRVVTMKSANFADHIKDRIRLWLGTWIDAPVARVVVNLKAELDRRNR